MSALDKVFGLLKDVIVLTNEVKAIGQTAKALGADVRDLDRRVTRLEAQWDTAMAFAQRATSAGAQRIRYSKQKKTGGDEP